MTDIIGIDIGATNIRVALASDSGNILKLYSEKTDRLNLMEQIYGKIDALGDFAGIGISSMGPLNSRTGMILNPPNIDVSNVKIVELLKKRYGKRCYLLNDCVAAVLAEKAFGEGKEFENLVYVTLSTGIGCGAIVDGRIILGKDGNAHEVGHFVVDSESKIKCNCGGYGHWECYCSGKNMPKFARYLLETDYKQEKTALRDAKDGLTSELLFKLAESDKVASEIIDRIGRINAAEIESIVNAYDPELITIGGAVALNNEGRIMKPILDHIKEYRYLRRPKIAITPLGNKIGICGAVAGFLYFDGKGILD
jgi:glucokinase